jgi:peroxiredoxin
LIDPQGVLRKVWLDVSVQSHSQEVLAAIDDLQKKSAATP